MALNSDFSAVLNEAEGMDVYLAGVVEGSSATTGDVDTALIDDTLTIGIGFKKHSNRTC